MTIGKVIRKYRKELGLTQEEMATSLGVTTPAVNKWENENTLPDINLLAPIARLLGISTDELLSFKDNLTDEEVDVYIKELSKKLAKEPYEDLFDVAQKKIEEYPNCEKLKWKTAIILDAARLKPGFHNLKKYDNLSIFVKFKNNKIIKRNHHTISIEKYKTFLREYFFFIF